MLYLSVRPTLIITLTIIMTVLSIRQYFVVCEAEVDCFRESINDSHIPIHVLLCLYSAADVSNSAADVSNNDCDCNYALAFSSY